MRVHYGRPRASPPKGDKGRVAWDFERQRSAKIASTIQPTRGVP